MAAVNKNFVVKNGIEVGDNLIVGNKDQLRVGIGTTIPNYTLDVRGGIGATNVSVGQTLTANIGIITTIQTSNLTIGSGLNVTGIATFSNNVGVAGIITATSLGISGLTTTQHLQVTGISTFNDEVYFDGVTTFTNYAQFLDNQSAYFGNGADLNVYHDGSNSYIQEQGAGNLYIQSNSGSINIHTNSTENAFVANQNGSVELYYDNSKKFETAGYGATVTGTLFTQELKVSGIATATVSNSTWSQVGSGLTFTTGIGTNLTISGVTTLGITTVSQLYSIGSVTAYSFRPSSGYYQSANGTNAFYVFDGTGNVAFQGTIGASQLNSASGNKVIGLSVNDAAFERSVSIASTLTVSGIVSTSNITVSGIASVGSGITLTSSGDAKYAGIITAYKFVGDGSELTGTISGVGIKSDGVTIGTGVTFIDFTGPGVSTVTVSVGIATINFEGGGSGTTIDKQTFNVGVGGTNLLTLSNSYTTGNIDIYVNGIKLSPGDFSELTATTVGLTTAAVSGDVIDIVSFRAINNITNSIGIQSGGVSIGGTFSTLNFIGLGNTFFDNGNGIVDISISSPNLNDDTATSSDMYPVFSSATTGILTTANVSSTKLTYNPSTGKLTSTIVNSSSDENLKKNITTIENALDKVKQLRGVDFTWKDTNEKGKGVIAQELQKVFPELVSEEDNGKLSVNYNGLIAVLIEAIKEIS